jgi:hypothetical protein
MIGRIRLDLFEVFPSLRQHDDPSLKGRSLRLLSLAAIVYDEDAYYFELSQPRYWIQAESTSPTIGVGGVKLRLTRSAAPLDLLLDHLRERWRSELEFLPGTQAYLLEDDRSVVLEGSDWMQPTTPHLLILTPPRLGGANTPDALAQVVYFIGLKKPPRPIRTTGIVRIKRPALGTFLAEENWLLVRLLAQSWADVEHAADIPPKARLRPVLALRGLRRLMEAELFPMTADG